MWERYSHPSPLTAIASRLPLLKTFSTTILPSQMFLKCMQKVNYAEKVIYKCFIQPQRNVHTNLLKSLDIPVKMFRSKYLPHHNTACIFQYNTAPIPLCTAFLSVFRWPSFLSCCTNWNTGFVFPSFSSVRASILWGTYTLFWFMWNWEQCKVQCTCCWWKKPPQRMLVRSGLKGLSYLFKFSNIPLPPMKRSGELESLHHLLCQSGLAQKKKKRY